MPYFLRDNATFAGISVKEINLTNRVEYINRVRAKFNSYGNEWEKAFFDEKSGGFNVYHKDHRFSQIRGGGEAEKIVGKILARNEGKQIEFLPEGEKPLPDIKFDKQTWDIKYIEHSNESTIREAIRDARKADNAIFYFTNEDKYLLLTGAIEREAGRYLKGQTNTMPDIYYIGKDEKFLLLWDKQKGLNK